MQAGLGEMEIKPESLRFIVCANNDLLQDSAFNIENWVLRKVSDAVRVTISNSIVAGDGLGKPMGFLNPAAGIPILDTPRARRPARSTGAISCNSSGTCRCNGTARALTT
jgi:HK97 family phage major capsid protein